MLGCADLFELVWRKDYFELTRRGGWRVIHGHEHMGGRVGKYEPAYTGSYRGGLLFCLSRAQTAVWMCTYVVMLWGVWMV